MEKAGAAEIAFAGDEFYAILYIPNQERWEPLACLYSFPLNSAS
jgi:hypothetical protein